MNAGPLIFLASFFALATSWFGFVLMPQLQIGRQEPVEIVGQEYPPRPPGAAHQGEQVYRANGCYYCHSQQVRPADFGTDVARGWGGRSGAVQSVAEDYLYAHPAMLGTRRVGPDLANVGLRHTNELEILQHIYNPRALMRGSMMPSYRYLFVTRSLKPGERPSPQAINIPGIPAGTEVVPTVEAHQLAEYLLSLHSQAILFETPPPPAPPTNAAAGKATNAPAAAPATNSAAK